MSFRIARVIFLLVAIGVFFLGTGWAQGVLPLEEVVTRVRQTILPPEAYQVNVIQSYFQGKVQISKEEDEEDTEVDSTTGLGEPQEQSAENTIEDSIFSIRYTPSKGYSTSKKVELQAQGSGTLGSGPLKLPPANERFNVNLVKLLNILSSMKEARVVFENASGRGIYQVSGQSTNNEFSLLVGIDAENWYVKSIVISTGRKDLYLAEIESRQVKGRYWLPSKIVMEYVPQGSKVILTFGDYGFGGK